MGGQNPLVRLGAAAVGAAAIALILWRYLRGDRKGDSDGKRSTAESGKQVENGKSDASAADGVWIYYGSQSGTAEGFSQELEQECAGKGLSSTVVDMEEFDPEEFVQHKVVILVVATYGEGDPTDNAVEFFKWIKDPSHPDDTLKGVKFTVMGLGNRQYVHFNGCAKDADKHMERLGATRIYVRGEGDDDQNLEEDFEQWKDGGLWPAIQDAVGVSAVNDSGASSALETPEEVKAKLPLLVSIGEDSKKHSIDPLVQNGGADVLGKWYFNASTASMVVNYQLRQKHDEQAGKTTKHIEFDIKHLPSMEWKTADNLEVLPRNPDEVVNWFAKRLGVEEELDSSMTFVRAAGVDKAVRKPFPAPCQVRNALALYCDLLAAPSRGAAKRFASLATDESDRTMLESLLQNREAYQWLTGDGVHLSLREFFELFLPSAEVDLNTFLQLCPRQKSRPYTIASSSLEDPKRIGICVSMVQEDSMPSLSAIVDHLEQLGHPVPSAASRLQLVAGGGKEPRQFRGSCSTMLCTQSVRGDKLMIATRASSFRLPKRKSTPIIMLGAGTGIAPFRAFVREFRAEREKRPKTILFFGCTKSTEDFVYQDELQEALEMQPPALKELVTAFSREQQHKIYVQHRLKERSEEVAKHLADGAYVYVCGAVSMGKAVRDELVNILQSSEQVDRLQREGRFVEELW